MSKRESSLDTECVDRKKSKENWSLGLLHSIKDPSAIYKETENIIVIKDKFAKAKIHYLMLPLTDIGSLQHLTKEHIDLLEEFGTILKDIREEHKDVILKAGFHAVPSMQRLHMHIISIDMVSRCLKTKGHWNSFNTSFFIPYEDVLQELKENGFIKMITGDLNRMLRDTPLKCNQCDFEAKNMPRLKDHLLEHEYKKNIKRSH